jgi:hypothetical protein
VGPLQLLPSVGHALILLDVPRTRFVSAIFMAWAAMARLLGKAFGFRRYIGSRSFSFLYLAGFI